LHDDEGKHHARIDESNSVNISDRSARRVRPRRRITGMSAILLPFDDEGSIDWAAFEAHVVRTSDAGLVPAVNMDTGYVQLLDAATVTQVLDRTAALTGGRFVGGAYVSDAPGDRYDETALLSAVAAIRDRGADPVVFPSHGLAALTPSEWIDAHARVGTEIGSFIAFELGTMFVPYGRIVDLDTYRLLLEIPQCIGAKHSSLSRQLEWDRLALRDELRPEFMVLTGNDLAIDMVMWGSDYLLGLSTFAPAEFALRDRLWLDGDPAFHELNDLLQYLGQFTFRPPVPGYRHDAAMFFQLRGWASSDRSPEGAARRPESDRAVLADIARRLEDWA
jgi:dihydrodipicolinate synthase/N-acetylneuraminate lyase